MVPTSMTASSAERLTRAVVLVACLALLPAAALAAAPGAAPCGDAAASCADCHPGFSALLFEAAAAKPTRIGEKACLVCHSDRPEMKSFPHRTRVEELGGCEVCHGAGSNHALSRGDPAQILNPRKAETAKADRSCLVCHSELTAPGHFTPAPGKEKCVDCHAIHAPAPVAAPAAPATPGRPAFRLDLGAEAPPPEAVTPFPMPALPGLPEDAGAFAGFAASGEIRAGARLVNVTGNDDVYDQDLDLGSGLRLFDFGFDARSLADARTKVSAAVTGLCDPVETARFSLQESSLFAFSTRAVRQEEVYRATGDPRDFASRRDTISTALSIYPDAPLRLTLGHEYFARDGALAGARFVDSGLEPVREPFDEVSHLIYGRADYHSGPFTGSLQQGYRRDDLESGYRTYQPGMPAGRHDQETDGRAPVTTLLLALEASEAVHLDGRFVYSDLTTETDANSYEDDGLSAVGTREHVEGDRKDLRAEVGGVWYATDDLSFALRGAMSSEDSDIDGRTVEYDPYPPVGPAPTDTTRVSRDFDRFRLTGEVGYRPCECALLRAGYEWLWEDYDRREDGDRESDSTDARGVLLGADVEPAKDLDISGLYRFVTVDDPFTEIGSQDADQARLRARYSGIEDVSVAAFVTHRLTTNQLHDTEVFAWVTGVTLDAVPAEGLTITATADWQTFDTQTDAVRYIGGSPVFGRSEYDGQALGLALDGEAELTPEFRLRAGGAWYCVEGDYEYVFHEYRAGGEYDLFRSLTVGADFALTVFDEDDANVDDYDAYRMEIWFRFRF